MTKTLSAGAGLFRGLMSAQVAALAVCSILAGLLGGVALALGAAWGAGICLLAHAWAGFQLWLHPGNRRSERRRATAALRAEIGKITIMLVLLWLTFREVPAMQTKQMAAALLVGFFVTQAAGLVWLARNSNRYLQQAAPGDNDSKQLD